MILVPVTAGCTVQGRSVPDFCLIMFAQRLMMAVRLCRTRRRSVPLVPSFTIIQTPCTSQPERRSQPPPLWGPGKLKQCRRHPAVENPGEVGIAAIAGTAADPAHVQQQGPLRSVMLAMIQSRFQRYISERTFDLLEFNEDFGLSLPCSLPLLCCCRGGAGDCCGGRHLWHNCS
jgi:hypothetical protein